LGKLFTSLSLALSVPEIKIFSQFSQLVVRISPAKRGKYLDLSTLYLEWTSRDVLLLSFIVLSVVLFVNALPGDFLIPHESQIKQVW